MSRSWELRQKPHRAYWTSADGGKLSWNGADKQRIVSVTRVLDGGQDSLTQWAAATMLGACEDAALKFLDCQRHLGDSLLNFAQLVDCAGRTPNQIRDAKGRSGDAAHGLFAHMLLGDDGPIGSFETPPYGLRVALLDFMSEQQPRVRFDEAGPQVERAVGDYGRAVAGTYDAVLSVTPDVKELSYGRWDLKQSRSLHGKHFAQLAAYERCAVLSGEAPCDYLALLHITPEGTYRVVSIPTDGPDAEMALSFFDAALYRYRHESRLDQLVAPPKES